MSLTGFEDRIELPLSFYKKLIGSIKTSTKRRLAQMVYNVNDIPSFASPNMTILAETATPIIINELYEFSDLEIHEDTKLIYISFTGTGDTMVTYLATNTPSSTVGEMWVQGSSLQINPTIAANLKLINKGATAGAIHVVQIG